MAFYINPSFRTTLYSWLTNASKPTQTYYVGLRTDFPTISDTLGAVKEIGTTTKAGYARVPFPPSSIGIFSGNGRNDVNFDTSGAYNPHVPFRSFTGAPVPGAATHWFLADSADSSGTLLASGPLCHNLIDTFTAYTLNSSNTAVAKNFGDCSLNANNPPPGALLAAVSAGQTTLKIGNQFTPQIGDYLLLYTNTEIVEIATVTAAQDGQSNSVTLAAPLVNNHASGEKYFQAATTRNYTPGFQEGFYVYFEIFTQNTSTTSAYQEMTVWTSARSGGALTSLPPGGGGSVPNYGAIEIDRIRQWQHLGKNATGAAYVQTNYTSGGTAFTGPAISGVDSWVRFRSDPRGLSLIMLGASGVTASGGTFAVYRSTDGGKTAIKVSSMSAASSLIEVMSERGLVIWMTADTANPPNISTSQGTYKNGTLVFGAAAPAHLVTGTSSAALTGTLLDMDYDPRLDTLYLLTSSGLVRSKDAGLTWRT